MRAKIISRSILAGLLLLIPVPPVGGGSAPIPSVWEQASTPWGRNIGALSLRALQKRLADSPAGRATFIAGDEDFIPTGTIVVSNGLLHDQILCVLGEGDAAPLPPP